MKIAIVAYIPVLHRGYLDFIKSKNPDAIFLITEKMVAMFDKELAGTLHRDLRAIDSKDMITTLKSLGLAKDVFHLSELVTFSEKVFIPDDIVVEKTIKHLFPNISYEKASIFLRWEWNSTFKQTEPLSQVISYEKFDKEFMDRAGVLAAKSPDWWRQVGAVIVGDKIINPIEAFNHHLPHEQSTYVNGDPRSSFNAGENIEMSLAIHAEASAICYAANKGISLKDAILYVTTFPCPVCARLILESGIKKVYYHHGYSRLDAKDILEGGGVQIFHMGNL
jgi:dCMP deaminase